MYFVLAILTQYPLIFANPRLPKNNTTPLLTPISCHSLSPPNIHHYKATIYHINPGLPRLQWTHSTCQPPVSDIFTRFPLICNSSLLTDNRSVLYRLDDHPHVCGSLYPPRPGYYYLEVYVSSHWNRNSEDLAAMFYLHCDNVSPSPSLFPSPTPSTFPSPCPSTFPSPFPSLFPNASLSFSPSHSFSLSLSLS